MAQGYLEMSGLWAKRTSRGEVFSARLTPAVRQKMRAALDGSEGAQAELVVMPTNYANNAKSPTHTLMISLSKPPEPTDGEA